MAGEYPASEDSEQTEKTIEGLLSLGITCFINLTEVDDGLPEYEEVVNRLSGGKATVVRVGVPDHDIPYSPDDTNAVINLINLEVQNGGKVYMHCYGGVGRTGMMVGCWLAREAGSGVAGLAKLREVWKLNPKSKFRQSPDVPQQAQYIAEWT